jgi:hypothetical protein
MSLKTKSSDSNNPFVYSSGAFIWPEVRLNGPTYVDPSGIRIWKGANIVRINSGYIYEDEVSTIKESSV